MFKLILISILTLSTSFNVVFPEPFEIKIVKNQKVPDTFNDGLKPIYSLNGQVKKMPINVFLEDNNVPGLRMVFFEKGKLLWSKDIGYADTNKKIKVDSNTVFAAASVSKPFAAVAALKLVEQGLLDLDEDVNNKLKGWKVPDNEFTKIAKVSLRHLIGHSSGFSRYYYSLYGPSEAMPTIEQMLEGAEPSKDMPAVMIYDPGNGYKYSNTGYLIIEKLIEDVSGLSFEKALDQLVLQPSGMTSSSFKQPMPLTMMKHKAIGYSGNGQPYPFLSLPFKALGGLLTTPDDLAKFISTLLQDYHKGNKTILSEEMMKQVFHRGNSKLGFSLWNWKDDIVFRHTGSNPGFTSFVFGSLNKQQVLAVMANGDNTQDLFDHLQRTVADTYDWDYFRSEQYAPYTGKIPDLKYYTGQYDWDGNYINFSAEQNGLYMQINKERYLLTPISQHEYILAEMSLKIVFPEEIKDKLNEVVIWKANGDYTKANRQ